MIELELEASLAKAKSDFDATSEELSAAQRAHEKAKTRYERLEKAVAVLNGSNDEVPVARLSPDISDPPPPPPAPRPQRNFGPYAGLACSACNEVGTLNEQFKQMKGGMVRLLVCNECGNERFLG